MCPTASMSEAFKCNNFKASIHKKNRSLSSAVFVFTDFYDPKARLNPNQNGNSTFPHHNFHPVNLYGSSPSEFNVICGLSKFKRIHCNTSIPEKEFGHIKQKGGK